MSNKSFLQHGIADILEKHTVKGVIPRGNIAAAAVDISNYIEEMTPNEDIKVVRVVATDNIKLPKYNPVTNAGGTHM